MNTLRNDLAAVEDFAARICSAQHDCTVPHSAIDRLLAHYEQLRSDLDAAKAELHGIDMTLGNASGFDHCTTRVEKIALMLRTLRERNVQPLATATPPRDSEGETG